jgi:16S rRNA (cytosine1402-N4)-methyltransferase
VDVTFGGGGHSRAILEKLNKNGRLFAFDQDPDAAVNIISDSRFEFIAANFSYLSQYLKFYKTKSVDGILADLGFRLISLILVEEVFRLGKMDV